MYFTESFLKKVYALGLGFSLILLLCDLIAFFVVPDTFFSKIFIATKEQTPLTWLSSVTFLFLALAALATQHATKKIYWGFLALIFFFFSIDDAVYLHERIAGYFREHVVVLQDFPSYIWAILYFPLLLSSLGTLLFLLWKKADRSLRFSVIGIFSLLSLAAVLDFGDGFLQRDADLVLCATKECHRTALHLMRLLEEILEVWSIGALGYVVLIEYCLFTKKDGMKKQEHIQEID